MSRPFVPRPYQRAMVEHAHAHARGALFAGMGLGKTVATLTALADLELTEPGPALVVAPLRVAQSTWPDEAAKWGHLAGFEVVPVVGSLSQRRAALRRRADVYTTNYEQTPWLVEELGGRWPFRKIVADESTRLKGFRLRQGTRRAKALAKVAHEHCTHWVNLTGTPARTACRTCGVRPGSSTAASASGAPSTASRSAGSGPRTTASASSRWRTPAVRSRSGCATCA